MGVTGTQRHAAVAGYADERPTFDVRQRDAQVLPAPQWKPRGFDLGGRREPCRQTIAIAGPYCQHGPRLAQEDATTSRSEVVTAPEVPQLDQSFRSSDRVRRRWRTSPLLDQIAVEIERRAINRPIAGLQCARQTGDFDSKPFGVAGCLQRPATALARHESRSLRCLPPTSESTPTCLSGSGIRGLGCARRRTPRLCRSALSSTMVEPV